MAPLKLSCKAPELRGSLDTWPSGVSIFLRTELQGLVETELQGSFGFELCGSFWNCAIRLLRYVAPLKLSYITLLKLSYKAPELRGSFETELQGS